MRPTLALAILCAALAGVIAYELSWTSAADPRVPPTATAAPGGADGLRLDIAYADKDAYSRVVDANLFSPDRTPPALEVPAATAPLPRGAPEGPAFELKGIIITPEGRFALVRLGGRGEYRQLVPGETVDGWTVETVAANSVLVKKQGTSTTVELKAPPAREARPADKRRRRQ